MGYKTTRAVPVELVPALHLDEPFSKAGHRSALAPTHNHCTSNFKHLLAVTDFFSPTTFPFACIFLL